MRESIQETYRGTLTALRASRLRAGVAKGSQGVVRLAWLGKTYIHPQEPGVILQIEYRKIS